MPECRTGTDRLAAPAQQLEPGAEADPAERHDDLQARQCRDLGYEVVEATVHLLRGGLVIGRGAPDGRRDEGVGEAQAVVAGA